jgi:hypothetical protein
MSFTSFGWFHGNGELNGIEDLSDARSVKNQVSTYPDSLI